MVQAKNHAASTARGGQDGIFDILRPLGDVLYAKGYAVAAVEHGIGHDYLPWQGSQGCGLVALPARLERSAQVAMPSSTTNWRRGRCCTSQAVTVASICTTLPSRAFFNGVMRVSSSLRSGRCSARSMGRTRPSLCSAFWPGVCCVGPVLNFVFEA